jgi:hypothetical protein
MSQSKTKKSKSKSYDSSLATRIIRAIEAAPTAFVSMIKTWQGCVILLVLVSQLLLPLHYYTANRDFHDERFAWRMFSPMRMTKCVPKFSVNEAPIQLSKEFHEAWIEVAKRGRFVVIEEMAAKLCEKNPGASVHVVVECQYLDRPAATWGGYDMCKVPLL